MNNQSLKIQLTSYRRSKPEEQKNTTLILFSLKI